MSNHMDFFISDLHFGHENIIKFDIRPFNNVENMNNIMINNWNKVVTNTDTVYILGDMFCSINSANAIEILEQLKGYKVLIMGNHDKIFNKEFANHFIEISDYKEIQCKEKHVVLCHYPIPCFNNHFLNNWYHFYGHVHQTFEAEIIENIKLEMLYKYNVHCNWIYTKKVDKCGIIE